MDISIDINIVAQHKDPASASRTKAGDAGGADKPAVVSNGFIIKSTTLGESNIIISGITPDGKAHIYGNDDNFTFSDWCQFIPDGANPAGKVKRGVHTISVTVKEANPYAVNAAQINKFFKDNGSDISGLLKAFIPGSSDGSGSSKK